MRQHFTQTAAPIMAIPAVLESSPHQGYIGNMITSGDGMLDTFGDWFPFLSQDALGHRLLMNFGSFEPAYSLNEVDLASLDTYNYNIPFDVHMPTPEEISVKSLLLENIKHTAALGHDAYKRTGIWRWRPSNKDTGQVKQQDLSLPYDTGRRLRTPLGGRKLEEKMDSLTRDKIVALVVSNCTTDGWTQLPPWDKWISSFPSVELLDALIQFCLSAPLGECDLLFHLPTLSIRKAKSELVIALVAFGAILTPDTSLQKLGMALQEVLRQSLPRCVGCNPFLMQNIC
jgi:hypothetical protein